MAEKVIAVGGAEVLSVGDTARVKDLATGTQYLFELVPEGGNPVIGIWKGQVVPKQTGVARNQPGVSKVYFTPKPEHGHEFVVTVESTNPVVTLSVKDNSFWARLKKLFGG